LDRLAAGWRLFVFLRYLFIPELPSLGAMRRTIIIYGLSMAALLGMLKYFEYQYFVRDMSIEFYVGAVAIMFTAIGIWAGLRLTRPTIKIIDNSIPFEADNQAFQKLGLFFLCGRFSVRYRLKWPACCSPAAASICSCC
jgi:hypothetical protein